ncbi:Wzz/FepE/Etk N-terminal domain-containing protein [Flavihumibacter sp. ZG627]|uniref:Wzz/FepE/Etk N-terminal domain-containing protein n=1 Tax=Flavihumibacter sp. ZG627 TaxID=1463156 RepID=UPI00057DB075|nr:Wzz/FepE/Etk N-terminal domain-containing protein [Flavihumibacter sp. ZG627]KIC92302.1 hypothetical protein HY58_01820 [Flavihumibacter sp. ZG627]
MSEQKSTPVANNQEDFSPRKFIIQLQEIAGVIRKKILYILLTGVLFSLAIWVYYSFKKVQYHAEITFALDEGAAPQGRSTMQTLGEELGMNTGTMEAGGVFSNVKNIMELLQSRMLVEKTLRSELVLKGKPTTYADFFLDSLDYREEWLKGKAPVHFRKGQDSLKNKQDSIPENMILQRMHDIITKKFITIGTKGSGTTIVSVSLKTSNELFSKHFLEALMNEVTRYYIETRTQRSKLTLAYIQKRVDSMRNVFSGTLASRAVMADANINPGRQAAIVPGQKKETDIQILKNVYTELFNSLESARTNLMRNTPLFQYLDMPILPLKTTHSSKMKYALVFFLLGLFVSSAWFTGSFIYQKIMRS